MKRIFRVFMLAAVAMMACYGTIYAQNGSRQRMTREELAEKQARYIANEMTMDDATTKRFVETFCQFQKDIWALGPRPEKSTSRLSDTEAEQAMNERFAHSQKILDLRKKYYLKYSKFLTPRQIERVYELERQMMNRLASMTRHVPAQDNGQQRMTPQQRTEQRIQRMDEKLSLTDTQKARIRKLYADFNKQNYPQEKRKEAMGKLITDITALLMPDQQVLYKQMQEEASAERMKNRRKD